MLLPSLFLIGCGDDPSGPSGSPSFRTTDTPSVTSATAVSHTQIDVTWQDNSSNESGFEVHRSTTGPSGTFSLLGPTGAGGTSYSDGGLTASTQYCYRTRAFRTTGKKTTYSEFSNVACATTKAPPTPAPASGTDARPVNSTTVAITWIDNSSDEFGFRVEFSLDGGATWGGVVGSTTVTTIGHWGLTSDRTVCYRVIAQNGFGNSAPSNVDCTAPPFAPTDLLGAGVAGPAIDLSWTPRSAVADGYHIERAGPGVVWTPLVDLPANASAYRDASVTVGTRYVYRVAAAKDGGYSDFVSVSAIASTELPAPPSSATATPRGSTFVGIQWTHDLTNVEGFKVERSTDGTATWTTIATTVWNQPWFDDPSVESDREVCYQIRATNSAGPSAPSPVACTVPPRAPTGLTATTATDGVAIELAWTDNTSAEDGYEVYRLFTYCDYYWGCYTYYASHATLSANTTRFRDEAVIPGEIYQYYVAARRDGGVSTGSNEASAVAPSPPR
jgi:titin